VLISVVRSQLLLLLLLLLFLDESMSL
jgi:hypothetical protein